MSSSKNELFATSSLLFIFGVCETITSFVIISHSGITNSGWYCGILAMLAGSSGVRITTRRRLGICIAISSISLVISFAISIYLSALYRLVNGIGACATYGFINSTTCSSNISLAGDFSCIGNSAYFQSAVTCESNDIEASCGCVDQQIYSSDHCYYFDGRTDCNSLLTTLPRDLRVSSVFATLCFIFSLFLTVLACRARHRYVFEDDLPAPPGFSTLDFGPPSPATAQATYVIPSSPTILHAQVIEAHVDSSYPAGGQGQGQGQVVVVGVAQEDGKSQGSSRGMGRGNGVPPVVQGYSL